MIGAEIRPAMKERRQILSPVDIVKAPPSMPLIPAIRPFNSINNADASPISPPPISAVIGSNAFIGYRTKFDGLSWHERVFVFKLRECIERMGRVHHRWTGSHINRHAKRLHYFLPISALLNGCFGMKRQYNRHT